MAEEEVRTSMASDGMTWDLLPRSMPAVDGWIDGYDGWMNVIDGMDGWMDGWMWWIDRGNG
jgi:hypothetical protein